MAPDSPAPAAAADDAEKSKSPTKRLQTTPVIQKRAAGAVQSLGVVDGEGEDSELGLRALRAFQLDTWSGRLTKLIQGTESYLESLSQVEAAIQTAGTERHQQIIAEMDRLKETLESRRARLVEENVKDMEAKRTEVNSLREATMPELAEMRRMLKRVEKVQQLGSPDALLTVAASLLEGVRESLKLKPENRPLPDASFRPLSADAAVRMLEGMAFTPVASRTEAEALALARLLAAELMGAAEGAAEGAATPPPAATPAAPATPAAKEAKPAAKRPAAKEAKTASPGGDADTKPAEGEGKKPAEAKDKPAAEAKAEAKPKAEAEPKAKAKAEAEAKADEPKDAPAAEPAEAKGEAAGEAPAEPPTEAKEEPPAEGKAEKKAEAAGDAKPAEAAKEPPADGAKPADAEAPPAEGEAKADEGAEAGGEPKAAAKKTVTRTARPSVQQK